jgi:hypothetical protein
MARYINGVLQTTGGGGGQSTAGSTKGNRTFNFPKFTISAGSTQGKALLYAETGQKLKIYSIVGKVPITNKFKVKLYNITDATTDYDSGLIPGEGLNNHFQIQNADNTPLGEVDASGGSKEIILQIENTDTSNRYIDCDIILSIE